MLTAIIAMAYSHVTITGQLSFYYQDWLSMELPQNIARWLMLGFLLLLR